MKFKLFETKDEYTNGFYDCMMAMGIVGLLYKCVVWAVDKFANK